jgi:hypothetical protein
VSLEDLTIVIRQLFTVIGVFAFLILFAGSAWPSP